MITIYTTEGCPKCRVLKIKMDKKNIPYEECRNIETLMELGILEVPVLKIGDFFISNIREQNNWIENYHNSED